MPKDEKGFELDWETIRTQRATIKAQVKAHHVVNGDLVEEAEEENEGE
jgi:hypothetical protein